MVDFIKIYFTALTALLVLDSLWIGVVAKGFYNKYLGYLMAAQVNLWPAVLFYIAYAAGLIYFVINPGLKNGSAGSVFLSGAFLGFLAYAAYDLTNHATIKNWHWQMTVVDLLWGTFLSAIVSTIVFLIFKR